MLDLVSCNLPLAFQCTGVVVSLIAISVIMDGAPYQELRYSKENLHRD